MLSKGYGYSHHHYPPSASPTSVPPSLLSPIADNGSEWDEEKGRRAGRLRGTVTCRRPLKREMGYVRWGRRRGNEWLSLVLEEQEGEESSWKEVNFLMTRSELAIQYVPSATFEWTRTLLRFLNPPSDLPLPRSRAVISGPWGEVGMEERRALQAGASGKLQHLCFSSCWPGGPPCPVVWKGSASSLANTYDPWPDTWVSREVIIAAGGSVAGTREWEILSLGCQREDASQRSAGQPLKWAISGFISLQLRAVFVKAAFSLHLQHCLLGLHTLGFRSFSPATPLRFLHGCLFFQIHQCLEAPRLFPTSS